MVREGITFVVVMYIVPIFFLAILHLHTTMAQGIVCQVGNHFGGCGGGTVDTCDGFVGAPGSDDSCPPGKAVYISTRLKINV